MKTFLKMLLAVIAGLIITSLLFFVVMLSALSGMAAAGKKTGNNSRKNRTGNENRGAHSRPYTEQSVYND